MCRMMLLKGEYEQDFPDIFKCFQKASFKDPYPDPETDYSYITHGDGWGYLNVANNDFSWIRKKDPVYEAGIPNIRNGTLLMHSRKASDDQPGGVLNNHPFTSMSGEYQMFLAHNGWFDKYSLSPKNGKRSLDNMTDSEAFLFRIADKDLNTYEDLSEEFSRLEEDGVNFALANVFLTVFKKGSERETVKSYYFTEKGKGGTVYGEIDKLYLVESDKWTGVFSSSVLYFPEFPKYGRISVVQRGQLLTL